jgi:cytochrome c oxidase subunit III
VEVLSPTTYSDSTEVLARATPVAAEPPRTGIWLAIFAITMSFAAFVSALFVGEGSGQWAHLALPRLIYVNTAVLFICSFTIQMARNEIVESFRLAPSNTRSTLLWVILTLLLGLGFVTGQYLVWVHFQSQGLYLATNPNSSFFYVLTGIHALHVLGGITALLYLIVCLMRSTNGARPVRRSLVDGITVYWHFMGVLWVCLLLVIRTKL